MRVRHSHLVRHTWRTLSIAGLLAVFAFHSGCEIDPDDDYPREPVVPKPDDPNGGGTDEPKDPNDPKDPQEPQDPKDPEEPVEGGGACFGHCDCLATEYCATVGTCQPRFEGAGHYCCDRADQCPAGARCHVPGTENEQDFCPED